MVDVIACSAGISRATTSTTRPSPSAAASTARSATSATARADLIDELNAELTA